MVLLEECIMSVMRVAAFLDVNIPWLKSDLLTTHVSKLGDCFPQAWPAVSSVVNQHNHLLYIMPQICMSSPIQRLGSLTFVPQQ